MCSLRLHLADLFHDLPLAHNYHWHKITVNQTGALYFSQACSENVFIFSRNKLMIPIVLSQCLWMFSVRLVFTSNLNSQTSWLKVKFKLVNLSSQTLRTILLAGKDQQQLDDSKPISLTTRLAISPTL